MHQFPENQNWVQQIQIEKSKRIGKINLIFNNEEIPDYIDRNFQKMLRDVAMYSQNFTEIVPLKSHQNKNDASI